jgi:uncharacterized protein (DUF433 family)
MSNASVIHSHPEILSGSPVFHGSRVLFQNFIDYIEAGHTLDEFLDDFSTVSRTQALAALEQAKEAVLASAVLLDECLPRKVLLLGN